MYFCWHTFIIHTFYHNYAVCQTHHPEHIQNFANFSFFKKIMKADFTKISVETEDITIVSTNILIFEIRMHGIRIFIETYIFINLQMFSYKIRNKWKTTKIFQPKILQISLSKINAYMVDSLKIVRSLFVIIYYLGQFYLHLYRKCPIIHTEDILSGAKLVGTVSLELLYRHIEGAIQRNFTFRHIKS